MIKHIIAIMLVASLAHAIPVSSTNVTVNTTTTTISTEVVPVSLEITTLTYDFNTERIKVDLLYLVDGEIVATGWALIKPVSTTMYSVSYFNKTMSAPVSSTVPKELLDSLGLAAGSDLLKGLASQLGGLIANMANP